jgi:hypothetical protein
MKREDPLLTRPQRKAKKARQRRYNNWMPGLAEVMFVRKNWRWT